MSLFPIFFEKLKYGLRFVGDALMNKTFYKKERPQLSLFALRNAVSYGRKKTEKAIQFFCVVGN